MDERNQNRVPDVRAKSAYTKEMKRDMGIVTTQKMVEQKAREIASSTFSDGTMRTMLYERIVDAFGAKVVSPVVRDRMHGVDCWECEAGTPHRHG